MKTTILIVNFNGHTDTIECLQSLFALNNDFNIVLVDNSDKEESLNAIEAWLDVLLPVPTLKNIDTVAVPYNTRAIYYNLNTIDLKSISSKVVYKKEVFIIRSLNNNGFAAANNLGLELISGYFNSDLIWLLNNDTIVDFNALNNLLDLANQSKGSGIYGGLLVEYHSPSVIQSAGACYNKYTGVIRDVFKGKNIDEIQGINVPRIDFPVGASLLITIDFLKRVGMLSEEYFLYFEELDWINRGLKFNYHASYSLNSIVWHKGGGSINKNLNGSKSKLSDFFNARSRLVFTKKFFSYCVPFIYLMMIFQIVNRIRRAQFDRVPFYFKLMFNPYLSINKVYALSLKKTK